MPKELSTSICREIEANYSFWVAMGVKLTRSEDTARDLVHHVIERISDKENAERAAQDGKLRYYVYTMMLREYINKDNSFYKLYRTHIPTLLLEEDRADETWIGHRMTNEQLDVIVNRLPPFNRVFLQAWILSDKSPRKLAEEIGIDPDFAERNIKETKRLLRNYVIRS